MNHPETPTRPLFRRRLLALAVGLLAGLAVFAAGSLASRVDVARRTIPLPPESAVPAGGGLFLLPYSANPGPFLEPAPLPGSWEDLFPAPGQAPAPVPARLLSDGAGGEPFPRRFSLADFAGREGYLVLGDAVFLSLPGRAAPPRDLVLSVPLRAAGSLALAAALAVGLLAWWAAGPRSVSRALLGLGAVLLALNVASLLVPFASPALERDPGPWFHPEDPPLSPGNALELLERRPRESPGAFAARATATVNLAMIHGWRDADADAFRLRVPLWENWVLYAASLAGERFRKYEFFDPARAIARGVGQCGQHALVLANTLKKNGIPARILNLPGHTVVAARAGGDWQVLDPDFGVILPLSPRAVEGRVDLVLPYYLEVERGYFRKLEASLGSGPDGPGGEMALIQGILRHGDRWGLNKAYGGPPGSIQAVEPEEYFGGKRNVLLEEWSYKAKWVIPLLLLLPAAVLAASGRKDQ